MVQVWTVRLHCLNMLPPDRLKSEGLGRAFQTLYDLTVLLGGGLHLIIIRVVVFYLLFQYLCCVALCRSSYIYVCLLLFLYFLVVFYFFICVVMSFVRSFAISLLRLFSLLFYINYVLCVYVFRCECMCCLPSLFMYFVRYLYMCLIDCVFSAVLCLFLRLLLTCIVVFLSLHIPLCFYVVRSLVFSLRIQLFLFRFSTHVCVSCVRMGAIVVATLTATNKPTAQMRASRAKSPSTGKQKISSKRLAPTGSSYGSRKPSRIFERLGRPQEGWL